MSGGGKRFVDAIIKERVLVVKNRSCNSAVIDCEVRTVARKINVAVDDGVPDEEVAIPGYADLTPDPSVAEDPVEFLARAQRERGPMLEIAHFWNSLCDICVRADYSEQRDGDR